jgi:hypothetical protein
VEVRTSHTFDDRWTHGSHDQQKSRESVVPMDYRARRRAPGRHKWRTARRLRGRHESLNHSCLHYVSIPLLQVHEHAAVDEERSARDVLCEVAREEDGRPRDVVRRWSGRQPHVDVRPHAAGRTAQAPERRTRDHARILRSVCEVRAVNVRCDRAGEECVCADAVPAECDCATLHERKDTGLRGRVVSVGEFQR